MSILLQITSGRGPAECCFVVAKLAYELLVDSIRCGLSTAIIEEEPGRKKGTLLSALIHIDGKGSAEFASSWEGTVQWIGTSPFRPGHKRKNWFVGVSRVAVPQTSHFQLNDVRMETLKASGPGGQHVNTTESAVRALHIPTGLMTIARDERSQSANRKLALERLAIVVARYEQKQKARATKQRWEAHNELVRGNPVRIYEGDIFRRVL